MRAYVPLPASAYEHCWSVGAADATCEKTMTPATAISTLTSAASAFERLRVKNFIDASPAVK